MEWTMKDIKQTKQNKLLFTIHYLLTVKNKSPLAPLCKRGDGGIKGLTLIELLISISVLAIFASTVAGLFYAGLNAYSNTKDESDITRQAMYAMERIVNKVRITKFLMLPNVNCNNTAILAISGGINNDENTGDTKVDEDLPGDMNNDGLPGIAGIDDDCDGNIDEGAFDRDDEAGPVTANDDPYNGIDNNGDDMIDEDVGRDMNGDGFPGIAQFDDNDDGTVDNGGIANKYDDDEDGSVDISRVNEDPIDTLIYYYDAGTKEIKEKLTNGITQVTTETTIAKNVEQFQVQYVYNPAYMTSPILLITLSMKDSKGRQVNLSEQVYPRNIVQKDGEKTK